MDEWTTGYFDLTTLSVRTLTSNSEERIVDGGKETVEIGPARTISHSDESLMEQAT